MVSTANRPGTTSRNTRKDQTDPGGLKQAPTVSRIPPLTELVARFLRSRHNLSPKTVDYYQRCLEGLVYFANLSGWPKDPSLITRDHLRDFVDYVATEKHRWTGGGRRGSYKEASPGTIFHYSKVAKTFFTWCFDEEFLKVNLVARFKTPKPRYKEVEPYTDEEVLAMLSACEDEIQCGNQFLGLRNKAIISIYIDTGLRLEENAGIELSNLDPKLQQVRVLGKGTKFRVVPLYGEARKALKIYLTQARKPGGNKLWQSVDGGPLSSYSIRIMINRLKRQAGVLSAGGAHRFRHYFATRYLEAGGDFNSLRLLLGHSTLSMVLKYTQFVKVGRAIEEHPPCSPLNNLYYGGSHNHGDENWGWQG